MQTVAYAREFALALGNRHIYRGLDLRVPAHGCTVLMGPSGTGKSTLLRLLCGQMQRHPLVRMQGELQVAGLDAHGAAVGALPALVEQKAQLLMDNVWQSLVGEWSRRSQLSQLEQKDALAQQLHDWGQQDLIAQYGETVLSLSKSQRKRIAIVRKALSGTPLLLIDEPTADILDASAREVVDLIRALARQMPVLVITHHQGHARAMADEVILLASGRVQEQRSAADFFAAPKSEAGKQWLLTGSCAEEAVNPQECDAATEPDLHEAPEAVAVAAPAMPAEPIAPASVPAAVPVTPAAAMPATVALAAAQLQVPVALPQHPFDGGVRARGPRGFTWIEYGRLAGTPYPGLIASAEQDLQALRDAGVTHLISLTERPFPAPLAAPFGITCSALPMIDMGVPSLAEAMQLCHHMDALLAAGHVIAVHCRAGLGRTGTVLAMQLIWQDEGAHPAADMIAKVRAHNGAMIQSAVQERFLSEFRAQCLATDVFCSPLSTHVH